MTTRKVVDGSSSVSVLWRCDHCGGPANWTFIDGEPYYRCKVNCTGFAQVDLFDTSGYIDSVVSVSGPPEAGSLTPISEVKLIFDGGEDDLPF